MLGGICGNLEKQQLALWKRRGDPLLVSTLPDGTTLYESDEPIQVLDLCRTQEEFMAQLLPRTPSLEELITEELQKHIPEGYNSRADRAPDRFAFQATIWQHREGAAVLGEEDIVARAFIDYQGLLIEVRRSSSPEALMIRLRPIWTRMLEDLHEDFKRRLAVPTTEETSWGPPKPPLWGVGPMR